VGHSYNPSSWEDEIRTIKTRLGKQLSKNIYSKNNQSKMDWRSDSSSRVPSHSPAPYPPKKQKNKRNNINTDKQNQTMGGVVEFDRDGEVNWVPFH
jgi:hypothetical protein